MSIELKDGMGRDPYLWNESLYFDNPRYRFEEAERKDEKEYDPEDEFYEDEDNILEFDEYEEFEEENEGGEI
jgi:hypothetical protein